MDRDTGRRARLEGGVDLVALLTAVALLEGAVVVAPAPAESASGRSGMRTMELGAFSECEQRMLDTAPDGVDGEPPPFTGVPTRIDLAMRTTVFAIEVRCVLPSAGVHDLRTVARAAYPVRVTRLLGPQVRARVRGSMLVVTVFGQIADVGEDRAACDHPQGHPNRHPARVSPLHAYSRDVRFGVDSPPNVASPLSLPGLVRKRTPQGCRIQYVAPWATDWGNETELDPRLYNIHYTRVSDAPSP